MKLDVLLSCMFRTDGSLLAESRITGDAVMVVQGDREGEAEYRTERGRAKAYFTTERGLTKSRNFAIARSEADLCLLCDDDEVFEPNYEQTILSAYEELPQADVIVFKMKGRPPSFPDRVRRLRFPLTMKVSSWQISFRRESLRRSGVRFDELLGAGSGNGAEEELKFLCDCERAGLKIYYVPREIATVAQEASTWFSGFNERFFYDRGATTRYILGYPRAYLYAVYYVLKKRPLYEKQLSCCLAWRAIRRGMREHRIGKQAAEKRR